MAQLKKLGRYELRNVLGSGAMGVVYEGFDPALGRRVAIKTILGSIALDPATAKAYSERFVREAQAVARLNHPNIVQVHDFGEEGEVAYLVMEFIQGRELRGFFEAKERFTPTQAVRIMGELLDALDFAHEAGVIHRDVKPANVMLDAQWRVKLADFGVARFQDSDRSAVGTMVGTPAFMSPEQISGGKVDRRTDLFSAGIVLYQLLTGEQPFRGQGAWTVAKKIMQEEPPPPSRVVGSISPAFDKVVRKALAKNAAERFRSAREFANALHGAAAGAVPVEPDKEATVPIGSPPVNVRVAERRVLRSSAMPLALAVLAAALAGVVFLYFDRARGPEPGAVEPLARTSGVASQVPSSPPLPAVDEEKIRRDVEERIRREYADKSAAEQAAAARAATEKAVLEKQFAVKAAAEKAEMDRAASEKVAAAKAAAERLAVEKNAADRLAAEKSAAEKVAMEKLAAEKAALEKAALEKAALEQAAAEKAAANKAAAVKVAMAAMKPGWPGVGDRWVYEARELTRPDRSYRIVVEAKSVSSNAVGDETVPQGKGSVVWTHRSSPELVGIAPGVAMFAPYLRAFQEIRPGLRWADFDVKQFGECATVIVCSPTAQVVGKEKISVKSGTYDAWKIVIDLAMVGTLRGSGQLEFWYAESIGRTVRYRSKVLYVATANAWTQPDMEMELVSHSPAGQK